LCPGTELEFLCCSTKNLRQGSLLSAALALPQSRPKTLDCRSSINRFTAPDLLQTAGDFLAQLDGV
jgi:hypothetical protein